MKTLRDYINLIEDAQTQAPAQAPADPNKLLVFINFASGQGNKEYDLTGIMQKNGWAGTPKQVVTQAEKWLSDYLRQRGDQWTSIQFTYNGIKFNPWTRIGDTDAPTGDPDLDAWGKEAEARMARIRQQQQLMKR